MSATRIATKTFRYAFGLNKQTAVGTPIAAAKLAYRLPFEGFSAADLNTDAMSSDRNQYGKGHDFATRHERINERIVIPQRTYDLTPLSAVWAPSFVLGGLTNEAHIGWQAHIFTFQDKYTQQECLYTSMVEDAGAYKELITGLVVNQFTLDFSMNQHVMISWDGQAFSRATSAIAIPALSTQECFFKARVATFSFGASPSSDVGASVVGGQLTFSQNPQVVYAGGASEANAKKPSYFLIGRQGLTGNLRVLMNSTFRNLFVDETECELIITLDGLTEIDATGQNYLVVITVPHFKIATAAMSEGGEWTEMTLAFTEETVLKDSVDDLVTYEVDSDLSNADILTASP